ncbi:NUDIX domain-containing protein [Candidatus Nomurabacteria bacterium]|nr:NUDIX domain-containing protein [Candidatus Nomurabacteria bacterium]
MGKAIKEQSYGIIPLYEMSPGDYRVLCIRQTSEKYWGLPKGHPERGEGPLESAKRELEEETGIVPTKVLAKPTFDDFYEYEIHGQRRAKTVTYFIGFVDTLSVNLLEREVNDFAWLDFKEAQKRLTHDGIRKIVKNAEKFLTKK